MIIQGITVQGSSRHPPQPKPPNKNDTACKTPNPPWWCSDTPNMPIDSGIYILLTVGLLFGLFITIKNLRK